ncbi:MAG: MoaD/ThiS family protein [Candidatus Thiodiazotropha sp. (ex Monitilora ramsayi)]|nr:MoaD/ThiS family protein [Candidatus Thiodiazotropha sp. (ex Monitilora ramsayi)]
MKIIFKLFASLSDLLPPEARGNALELEITSQTTIGEILEAQRIPEESAHLVMVNGIFVAPSERASKTLQEADELAIWPPVAGG